MKKIGLLALIPWVIIVAAIWYKNPGYNGLPSQLEVFDVIAVDIPSPDASILAAANLSLTPQQFHDLAFKSFVEGFNQKFPYNSVKILDGYGSPYTFENYPQMIKVSIKLEEEKGYNLNKATGKYEVPVGQYTVFLAAERTPWAIIVSETGVLNGNNEKSILKRISNNIGQTEDDFNKLIQWSLLPTNARGRGVGSFSHHEVSPEAKLKKVIESAVMGTFSSPHEVEAKKYSALLLNLRDKKYSYCKEIKLCQ